MPFSAPIALNKLHEFREVVARARELEFGQSHFPVKRFLQFVAQAKPVILEPAESLLDSIARNLEPLSPFLFSSRHDLLRLAGLSYAEDAYTELMRWAMDEDTHPRVAKTCQRLWLEALGVEVAEGGWQTAKPRSQVYTFNGVPDLLLHYTDFVVVVEAKTGSSEHGARGTDVPQTLAYPAAVREALGLPADFPTYMVFLTPDRSAAANEDALLTSYLQFAVILAKAVASAGEDVAQLLHWAYAAVITHLATCAVPAGCDVRHAMQLHTARREGRLQDAALLNNLHNLLVVQALLPEN